MFCVSSVVKEVASVAPHASWDQRNAKLAVLRNAR